jgi:HEAT repeat protein
MLRLVRVTALALLALQAPGGAEGQESAAPPGASGPAPAFRSVREARGTVLLLPRAEGWELRAADATLEEVLTHLAEAGRVTVHFHCNDPTRAGERLALQVAGASHRDLTVQVLAPAYSVQSAGEGGEPPPANEAAVLDAYPPGCPPDGPIARSMRPLADYPALNGPPAEVAFDELARALDAEGPEARRQAMKAVGYKTDGADREAAFALARRGLADSHPLVVLEAARALRRLGREGDRQAAAAAVSEAIAREPLTDLVMPLAQLDVDAAWPVIDALTRTSDPKVQAEAVRALVVTRDRRGLEFLARTVARGEPELARQAALALGTIGGEEGAAALGGLLRHVDAEHETAVARAIALLPEGTGETARQDLALRVSEPEVPDDVLRGLVGMEFLPPLEALLRDPGAAEGQKVRVLQAAAARGNERTLGLPALALDDASQRVRREAVKALGAPRAPEAGPYLIRATSDADPGVRLAAVEGLGPLPPEPLSVQALGRLLSDPDEGVRRAAVDALRDFGEPNEAAREVLLSATGSPDRHVADTAVAVLRRWGFR